MFAATRFTWVVFKSHSILLAFNYFLVEFNQTGMFYCNIHIRMMF